MIRAVMICLLAAAVLAGCGVQPPLPEESPAMISQVERAESTASINASLAMESLGALPQRLDPPVFLKQENLSLCPLATEYLTLSEKAFAEKYPPETLWQLGAFDRLLFTKRYHGAVVADIAVGDSIDKVIETLGTPQFEPDAEDRHPDDYGRFFRLAGYKTPTLYFVFEGDSDGVIQSICLRRRYPLPPEKQDILPVLAAYAPWYGKTPAGADWERCFGADTPYRYEQLARGSMTLLCDYGFLSTSLGTDSYDIFADFEGEIPALPPQTESGDRPPHQPITLRAFDYPQEMIYRIYTYLAKQQVVITENTGFYSPNAMILAVAAESDPRDLDSIGLYEDAHVILHWMDGAHPDRNVSFGHFSTVIGFPSDRYLIECNMLGLHLYDLQTGTVVCSEDSIEIRSDLRIDRVNQRLLDGDNHVWYTYTFDSAGTITMIRL